MAPVAQTVKLLHSRPQHGCRGAAVVHYREVLRRGMVEVRTFDNSVWLFSQGVEDEEVDEDEDLPRSPPRQRRPSPGAEHGVAPTATRRRRCSPFQAKRIVAAQGWRCACGCVDLSDPLRRGLLLDESFEIDHIRPLAVGGSDAESNLRALLRTHHQAISSAFARGRPS